MALIVHRTGDCIIISTDYGKICETRERARRSLEKLFQKVFNTRRLRQPRLISDNENVVAPVCGYNHSICTLDDLVGIRIALRAEP